MIGDTSNYLALAVKPLDVATPLMQAAKLRQSQMEEQQTTIQMHRDAIGAEARGLAPLVGTPDYESARQASGQRLSQMGILNSPQAQAGWERDSSSPLGIQSLIARTNPPQMALQEKTLAETIRSHKAGEEEAAATLAETTRKNKAAEEQGKILPAMNPLTGEMTYQRVTPEGIVPLTPKGGGNVMSNATGYSVQDVDSAGKPIGQPSGGTFAPTQPGAQSTEGKLTAEDLMKKYGGKSGDGRDWNYLASLPAAAQERVVRLANHDTNPASYSLRIVPGAGTSARSAVTDAAALFDKTYNQQDYPNIQKNRLAFDTGPEGKTLRSLNVVTDHLDTLKELGTALQNGDYRIINQIRQKWKEQTGSDLPTNLKLATAVIGTEVVKALGVAGAGSEKERAHLSDIASTAASPEQFIGAVNTSLGPLLVGQIKGLRDQFVQTTRRPVSEFDARISPNAKAFLKVGQGAGTTPAAPEQKTQTGVPWRVVE